MDLETSRPNPSNAAGGVATPSARPERARRALGVLLAPYLIVIAGVVSYSGLVNSSPSAKIKEAQDSRPLVKVEKARLGNHPLTISAYGTVVPSKQVTLQAEVGGRVVWRSDALIPGGRFEKGARMVKIDPRNYQVALQQQNAQLGRSKMEYELEQGRQDIAQREWKMIGGESKNDLALRGPQVRTAEANLEAAQSGLRRARIDLSRTTLEAPFDSIVQSEVVDVGQLVGPQAPLATLAGTESAWVQVSVPTDRLRWIGLDGFENDVQPEATVYYDSGGTRHQRKGKVTHLLGDLDPSGRMARLLVEIKDPLRLEADQNSVAPLFFGSYVEVEIKGQTLENGVRVPRRALREGDRVYLVEDGKLEIRKVTPAWRESESVIIQDGIREGELFVTTRISTPVPAMKLRTVEAKESDANAIQEENSIGARKHSQERDT